MKKPLTSKRKAVRILNAFIKRSIDALPGSEQIEIYDAFGLLMPTKKERGHATHIAGALREAEVQQLDFSKAFISEVSRHHHNGGDGKS